MNQGREGQKFPNECLLMVFEHLHDDLKTLRSLPLVNKFCFEAAVPLMYCNPLKDWTRTDPSGVAK
ncbi:hypothetical protein BG000_007943 [Podila horticola]|nr:hypothetical protein BG000_007943 [Podila horticola]